MAETLRNGNYEVGSVRCANNAPAAQSHAQLLTSRSFPSMREALRSWSGLEKKARLGVRENRAIQVYTTRQIRIVHIFH